MEINEILSSIGLPIAAIAISGISLYISVKNRRNGMREYIYKEQLDLYFGLFLQISKIQELLEDYQDNNNKLDDKEVKKLQIEIDTYDYIFSKYIIVVPNKIFKPIMKIFHAAQLIIQSIDKKENADKGIKEFDTLYHDLIKEVQEFAHIKELSDENHKLLKIKQAKQSLVSSTTKEMVR